MRASLETAPAVRRGGPDDEDFVARLGASAFYDFDPQAREHTLELVREPGSTTLVASAAGVRLGFAVLQRGRDGAFLLQAIAVAPNARGRGVGRLLLAGAEHAARRAGAASLRLCTAQANLEALEFFLKHGFRIERRIPRFYAKGQDACTLVKPLGAGAPRAR